MKSKKILFCFVSFFNRAFNFSAMVGSSVE